MPASFHPLRRLVGMLASTRRHTLMAGLAALALASTPALAQSDKGPIRMLVGFPAGGTIDVVARILADHLKDELGTTVIIESKPGAGGLIAAQALKAAPADGRTMLLSPDHTIVMSPLTMKTPGFQPLTDFAPVAQVARYAGGFAVHSGVEARNLDQYFAWAKGAEGRGNIGIPAPGSIPQFFVHLLAQQTRASLVSVPYRGSAPMLQDLMGGQISAGTTALGDFVEAHAAGKVRVIAVLGDKRSAAMPEVPTFSEQGYKISWEYWLGMFMHAKTDSAEVQRVNAALRTVLARPDVRERMHKIVFEPAYSSPQDMAKLVRSGVAMWEPVIRASGWVAQ